MRVMCLGGLVLLLTASCQFDRTGLPGVDYRLQIRPPKRDVALSRPDAEPQTDAMPPDSNAKPPHDLIPDPDLQLLCPALFGKVPGFVLCDESPTGCWFHFSTSFPTSCDDHCGLGGCTEIQKEQDVCKAVGTKYTCSSTLYSGICVCTK